MPFVLGSNERLRSIKLEFGPSLHCNYRCAHCSHVAPFLKSHFADLERFTADVTALAQVLHVGRFRFAGGEPLLHPDLLAFVEVVRQSGIADRIQVCTNGVLLSRMPDSFFRLIDSLAISWYDDRLEATQVEAVRQKCRQSNTKFEVQPVRRFRIMDADEPLPSPTVRRIFDSCQIAHSWYCQTFLDGLFYLCSRPLVTDNYLQAKGLGPTDFRTADALPIHQPNLHQRMIEYLSSRTPLGSCSHCLGTVGRHERWRELERGERKLPRPNGEGRHIDRWKLGYLLTCNRLERLTLRRWPSLGFARLLTIMEGVPYYFDRRRSSREQP